MKLKLWSIVAAALLVAACAQAGGPPASSSTTPASASTSGAIYAAGKPGSAALPAPVRALSDKGLRITGDLRAPKGYRGFIAQYQGQPLPVYLLPDGRHVVVGSLYDAGGKDLTMPAMRDALDAGLSEAQWQQLEKSSWVVEGNPKAKRVVYVFVDTRCPYCHKLWEASQPYLDKGNVQVRNILVAVISPSSLPEGAAILDARDPAQAWRDNERNFGHNPRPAANEGSAASRAKIRANNALMMQFGSDGTPTEVYKDADGKVRMLQGMPANPEMLETVFGGR